MSAGDAPVAARRPSFARARQGTAAIEFALVVPFMLLLMAGLVEFGAILKVYNQTNRLATQYAIAWSDCPDTAATTCRTELAQYTTTAAIGNVAPQLQASGVTLEMFQILMVGANPTVTASHPATAALGATQAAAARATFTDGQIGVVVHARYAHTLRFFPDAMEALLGTKLNPAYTVAQLKQ